MVGAMELAVEDHVLLEHSERAGKLFERRRFVVQFWETALDRFAACRQQQSGLLRSLAEIGRRT
jgi:hypothetical protein